MGQRKIQIELDHKIEYFQMETIKFKIKMVEIKIHQRASMSGLNSQEKESMNLRIDNRYYAT